MECHNCISFWPVWGLGFWGYVEGVHPSLNPKTYPEWDSCNEEYVLEYARNLNLEGSKHFVR